MPIMLWHEGGITYEAYASYILHRLVVYNSNNGELIFRKIGISDLEIKRFISGAKKWKVSKRKK